MKVRTEADFDDLVRGAKLVAIAAAWRELGLWDELARRPGATDLAELPGDTRALRLTAHALAHAGLLEGDGYCWQMSETARRLHEHDELPSSRHFEFFTDWAQLPEVLRHGGPVRDQRGKSKATWGGIRPEDREATREFLAMLHRRSATSAEAVADWIAARLPTGGQILDVGGGHGRYAEAFVERGLQVTLFDFPIVIELTRGHYGEHFEYRAGNFHTDTFGGPYDAVFLSNILHGESSVANAALIRRLAEEALRPDGWLLFKDMFIDEQGRNPENAVFFATTMLFYTTEGQSYTLREIEAWCRAAGCETPEVIGFDSFTLVLARKGVAAQRVC